MEERIREIHDALVDEYGTPDPPRDIPPVDSLIHTILSQNTSDENRDAAWDDLVSEFGSDYAAIENADQDALAETIRTAGLGNQKAARIQDALRTVREHEGEYSMAFIEEMDVEEALAWLTNIKGIGPKTAGIILLFRFDKPYFPVDTHCERVAKRFELIPEDASYEQAHELLTERVPDDIHYSFHRLLIDHGRAYCSARNPRCSESPVCREYCQCEVCVDG
ncbi:endonuclease III domain-containing protein [Halovenus marina]|uniref:endonuclease III domain-containing protein n=1 Tax=Halovenus marina TaxID=3396621 RepID=UPI003F556A02